MDIPQESGILLFDLRACGNFVKGSLYIVKFKFLIVELFLMLKMH